MVMDSNEQTDVEMRRQDERVRLLYVDIQSLHARIDKLVREKRKAEFDLEKVYASFSWRITGIVRGVRYVCWTLPILCYQWGQRIFLDKGLIKKNKMSGRERPETIQSGLITQKKPIDKNNPFSEYYPEYYPEYKSNLVIADYETKYVGKQSESNNAWSKQAIIHYKDSPPFEEYDLRNPGVFRRQAQAARDTGLDGFCYRYRDSAIGESFDGPIMNHYRNADVELYYCVCWSNDSVDAEKFELLKPFYLRKFIQYCSKLFDDKRYLYKESRPLILVKGLSDEELNFAKNVWQQWSEDAEKIMPFVLCLDGSNVKELGSSDDRSKTDYFRCELNSDNLGFLPTLINHFRSYRVQGELLFLSTWNDWEQKLTLESSSKVLLELKKNMKRAMHVYGSSVENVVALIVDKSIETDTLRKSIHYLQNLGYESKLVILDSAEFNLEGVSSLKIRQRDRSETWHSILQRMEQQGCHIAIPLVKMSDNLTQALSVRGWKVSHRLYDPMSRDLMNKDLIKKDQNIENLREDLRSSGLWLPGITVICDVSSRTSAASLTRFIIQLEKQYLVPLEVIFKGPTVSEKVYSKVISSIRYVEKFNSGDAILGELVWICCVETMLKRDFLLTQSRLLQRSDIVAVVYPLKVPKRKSSIIGRNFSRLKEVRTKNIVSFEQLKSKNCLGAFLEVLVKRSDFEIVLHRAHSLDQVFQTQRDWITWLLLAQRGGILKSVRSEVSILLNQAEEKTVNHSEEMQILESYLGNEMKVVRKIDGPTWADTQHKLQLLDRVMSAKK